ncbi:DUF4397 domain-containing protein [Nannocystis sp.]|uniref:DUF4397 domain-containing protein n=1 Tax=Nannocystis sp. TaxID=1962667 RepID=UPI002421AE9E|nr:DUF4397 domain-containing protein [Nannocystis sp.]MBK7829216.1 DUF4397 domain-containing protein [Nannocystis sp.]MBK9751988.1 DUF4397 domain-containing protein [Nannocystis sp.]
MNNRTLSIPLLTITLALGACSDDGSDTTESGATTSAATDASTTVNPTGTDASATDASATDASATDAPTTTDPGTTGDVETTTIRVIHLAPDAPAVDIFANGDGGAPVVDGLPLKSSGTVIVPAGEYSFAIAADGSPIEDAVFSVPALQYEAGKIYTVVALGKLGNNTFDVIRLEDDLGGIDAAQVRLQVTHAAAGAAFAEVDVWAGPSADMLSPLIPDFPFKASGNADVPDSDLVVGLDVDNDQTPDAVWNIPGAALTPGLGILVHVFAFSDDQDAPSLQVVAADGPAIQLNPS